LVLIFNSNELSAIEQKRVGIEKREGFVGANTYERRYFLQMANRKFGRRP